MPDHVRECDARNERHARNERDEAPDVLELLEEELKSCVMPDIKDTSKATTDDVVRDMHRVLTGNGGPTHGLIYKVAAGNVTTKLLRRSVNETTERLNEQVLLCSAVQEEKARQALVEASDKVDIRKVKTIVWTNRYLIIAILAAAALLVIDGLRTVTPTAAAKATERSVETSRELQHIQKMMETIMKLQGIDPAEADARTTNKQPITKITSSTGG